MISERIFVAILRGLAPTVIIIITYAPMATSPHSEKEWHYAPLEEIVKEFKTPGPLIIIDDFNARLSEQFSEQKQDVIGTCIFNKQHTSLANNQEICSY